MSLVDIFNIDVWMRVNSYIIIREFINTGIIDILGCWDLLGEKIAVDLRFYHIFKKFWFNLFISFVQNLIAFPELHRQGGSMRKLSEYSLEMSLYAMAWLITANHFSDLLQLSPKMKACKIGRLINRLACQEQA